MRVPTHTMNMAVRGTAARYPAPGRSPPTARLARARWQPPGGRSRPFTVSIHTCPKRPTRCLFWQVGARSSMRRLRAAARSETAAVAPMVAPGMRGVGLQPPVDRTARAGAPTSATTAGISSARGRNRAQKARVRGLGAGTHLHGRPKEALPPPMGQVAGGAPPPDAKTAF